MALSLNLFDAGTLMVLSYRRLVAQDVGYPANEVLAVRYGFASDSYRDHEAQTRVARQVAERLLLSPRVTASSIRGDYDSLRASSSMKSLRRSDASGRDDRLFADRDTMAAINKRAYPQPRIIVIDDDYFHALGLAVLHGRSFTNSDRNGSSPVAVVSAAFARLVWGRASPIGRILQVGAGGVPVLVVGEASDVRELRRGPRGFGAWPLPLVYLSARQAVAMNPQVVARAAPGAKLRAIDAAEASRAIDPRLPIQHAAMLSDDGDSAKRAMRLIGTLFLSLALCGTVLCVSGIVGIVSYSVAVRRREIGIRIALGAPSLGIMSSFIAQTLRSSTLGVGCGILLAVILNRLLSGFLFNSVRVEVGILCACAALFFVAPVLATYVCARSAIGDALTVVLRAE